MGCQDDLNSFLTAAEDLKIKGLTQNSDRKENQVKKSPYFKESVDSQDDQVTNSPTFCNKRSQEKPSSKRLQNDQNLENDDVDEVSEVKQMVPVKVEPQISDIIVSNDDYGEDTLNNDDFGEEALHYEGANELFLSGSAMTMDSTNKDYSRDFTKNEIED